MPQGLCFCEAMSACDNSYVKRLYTGVETPVISGNVTPPVASGSVSTVRFTELYTYIARSDLRLVFRHLRNGVPTGFNATSDRFAISAGRLHSIEVATDPSKVCLSLFTCGDVCLFTRLMSGREFPAKCCMSKHHPACVF